MFSAVCVCLFTGEWPIGPHYTGPPDMFKLVKLRPHCTGTPTLAPPLCRETPSAQPSPVRLASGRSASSLKVLFFYSSANSLFREERFRGKNPNLWFLSNGRIPDCVLNENSSTFIFTVTFIYLHKESKKITVQLLLLISHDDSRFSLH